MFERDEILPACVDMEGTSKCKNDSEFRADKFRAIMAAICEKMKFSAVFVGLNPYFTKTASARSKFSLKTLQLAYIAEAVYSRYLKY